MSPFHFCLSAARNLSIFQLLPASLITDLLQLFFGLPRFLFSWGFQSRAAFGTCLSSFLNVWQIHLNFLFLISKFISSCPVTFHRSLLEIIFGHHILSIYLRHLFTKVCILRWISFVTSQVSHPYSSTDFTQALYILILVSFRNDLDSHTFLSLENDPLAFCILTLTSLLVPPFSATANNKTLMIWSVLTVCYVRINWFRCLSTVCSKITPGKLI